MKRSSKETNGHSYGQKIGPSLFHFICGWIFFEFKISFKENEYLYILKNYTNK
jgi:hypothetical protein